MTLYSRAETNAQSLKVLNTTEKNSVDKYDWDDTLIVDGDTTVAGAQGYATAARKTIFIDDVEATLAENRERGLTAPGWWEYMTYTDADGKTRHKAQHLVAFKDAPVNAADLDDAVAADVASAISISSQPSNQSTRTPAGAILTVTRAGTAATGTGTYTINSSTAGIVVTNVSGGAAPAANGYEFTVSRSGGTYTVTVVTGGSGFAATDTILVKGSTLGGVDTTNDLTITVATVATAAATFSVTASATTGSLVYQWQRRTTTGGRWSNISGATSSSLALTGLTTASDSYEYRVKLTTSAGAEEVISNAATLTVTAA
jgi:hypothetical protein